MDCTEARKLLLEADLAELRGEGESPLAMHLVECADCRKAAGLIVGAESALASALEVEGPVTRFEEAVAQAVHQRQLKNQGFRKYPILLPLAAAAVLLILLLPRLNREIESPIEIVLPELQAELPAVKVPPGKTAMILDSGSPDYQIIWLF